MSRIELIEKMSCMALVEIEYECFVGLFWNLVKNDLITVLSKWSDPFFVFKIELTEKYSFNLGFL